MKRPHTRVCWLGRRRSRAASRRTTPSARADTPTYLPALARADGLAANLSIFGSLAELIEDRTVKAARRRGTARPALPTSASWRPSRPCALEIGDIGERYPIHVATDAAAVLPELQEIGDLRHEAEVRRTAVRRKVSRETATPMVSGSGRGPHHLGLKRLTLLQTRSPLKWGCPA